jgi:Zn-dependent protease/CBS domain-containing protein
MNPHGIRIGRVLGIDVLADRSWILVFLLVTWNLTEVFVQGHPAWGFGPSVLLATVASLLFFASILVHEFAHALAARGWGMQVRSITLFLFGGVSNLEHEPPSPAAEFWMAIAGPFASFALGVGFVFVWILFGHTASSEHGLAIVLTQLDPLSTLLLWLGPVNVVIGVFNLVPGFPLDGGRVLRALLWALTRDLNKATRWASAVGQAIGWTFVVAGMAALFGVHVPFVGAGPVAGLWFACIGWFLASAAQRSYQSLLVHGMLQGVPVWRLMRVIGPAITAETTVGHAASDAFLRSGERALPVLDDGRFVGLVSVTDLRAVPRDQWHTVPIRAVMTPSHRLVTTAPDEGLEAALRKLGARPIHQLPVMREGRLVGMLQTRDVARWVELHVQPPLGHATSH